MADSAAPPPVYIHPPRYPNEGSSGIPPIANPVTSQASLSIRRASQSSLPQEETISPAINHCNVTRSITTALELSDDVSLTQYFRAVPVDIYTCAGNTALFLAIRQGNIRLVRFLLDQGADPSRWCSAGVEVTHPALWQVEHPERDFFLDVPANAKDMRARILKYEKSRTFSKYEKREKAVFRRRVEALYSARTPLMEAASQGNLAIARLLVEQHGVDPLAVAPDGQTAFRLARDNGHRTVADFLPATRKGGMRRIKYRFRTTIRRTKKYGHNIYVCGKFVVWDIPKFFIWTIPKALFECIFDRHEFEKFLHALFIDIPKAIFWDFPKALPSIVAEVGHGIWTFLTVDLAPFLRRVGKSISTFVQQIPPTLLAWVQALGRWVWNVLTVVIPRWSRAVTQFVWRGIKSLSQWVWDVLTVRLPKAVTAVGHWLWNLLTVQIPKAATSVGHFLWTLFTVDIPKIVTSIGKFFWSLLKTIPKVFKALGLWIWKIFTVHLVRFIKRFAVVLGKFFQSAGQKIGAAFLAIVSSIHTFFVALATFFRRATMEDVWNGISVALRAIFLDLPNIVWVGMKGTWKAFNKMMSGIFGIFWCLFKCIGEGVLYIPKQIWKLLVELASLLAKVGKEMLSCINPKW